jgi:hypothetical protein
LDETSGADIVAGGEEIMAVPARARRRAPKLCKRHFELFTSVLLCYFVSFGPAYRNQSGMRNSDGTFLQGHSGNPNGRTAIISELQKLARTHTPTALATLVEIMSDTANPPNARVSAAVDFSIVVMADHRPRFL